MIRRNLLKAIALGTSGLALGSVDGRSMQLFSSSALKGNINHYVCSWTYSFLSLEELCKEVKKIGLSAIDLVGPEDWDILKKNGIDSSMCNGAEISLTKGWNDPQ